jgi:hypothetical protein
MGILGVIGTIILVGEHYGFDMVSDGWYWFWFVVVCLNILSMGLKEKNK